MESVESLRELNLRISYRTGRDNLVEDFFVPCLKASTLYRRAAGYFSSAGLALAARGVAHLAGTGGTMQLVVSPYLQPEDVEALQRAVECPAEVLRAIVARNLDDIEDALIQDRLNALAWLAASRRLEIKLALRLNESGNFARGLFHEKAGIFSDATGNHVAFSGSSNETAGGLLENFESVKVFCSWKDAEGRVQEEIDNFESLWNDATPGLKILEFSEAGRALLERFRDPEDPLSGIESNRVEEGAAVHFVPPRGFELRPYQVEAIRAWSRAGGRGIFAMATGAGKTLTALTLASKVAERNAPMALIIVCPFINLCRQWIREVAAFGVRAVAAFEGRHRWQAQFEEGYQSLAVGMSRMHVVVTTNATFQSDAFQRRLRPRVVSGVVYHLLIADEAHNLGRGKAHPRGASRGNFPVFE